MKTRSRNSSALAGVALLLPLAIGFSPVQAAIAQDSAGCYMVTSSGKVIVLNSLCGQPAPSKQPLVVPSRTPQAQYFMSRIKRRIGGIPVIDVTFNGSQTFEMILDTGASGTLITQKMARSLSISPVEKVSAVIADGRTVEFPVGYVQSISVNGATVQQVPVAIADMDIGLLGHDFFDNYDLKIRRDVVEFYPR